MIKAVRIESLQPKSPAIESCGQFEKSFKLKWQKNNNLVGLLILYFTNTVVQFAQFQLDTGHSGIPESILFQFLRCLSTITYGRWWDTP